jgi:hypothetical protein
MPLPPRPVIAPRGFYWSFRRRWADTVRRASSEGGGTVAAGQGVTLHMPQTFHGPMDGPALDRWFADLQPRFAEMMRAAFRANAIRSGRTKSYPRQLPQALVGAANIL